MLTILRKEILQLLKDKGTFFWLVVLPIAFIVLFSSIFGQVENSEITIQYIDQDQSSTSEEFIMSLNQVNGFVTVSDTTKSLEQQLQEIKDGDLSALIVIPNGFEASLQSENQINIKFYRTSTSFQTVESINALLHNRISQYRDNKIQSQLSSIGKTDIEVTEIMSSPIIIDNINMDIKAVTATTQVVPGMMVMFVFFILISMSRAFIIENKSGMLARLRTTSMKPLQYLIGMWIAYLIIVLIQCAILLSFGRIVYNLNLGDIFAIIPLIITLAISATGIGLVLSLFVKSENQGVAVTQIFVMGGAVLGGLWFPYELLPRFAQRMAQFAPQYWAQNGMQSIMVRGAHIQDILPHMLVLLGFGIGGIVLALLRFKRYILSVTS